MDLAERKILKASLIEVQEALIVARLEGDLELTKVLFAIQKEKAERLKNGIPGGNNKGTTATS